MPAMHDKAAAKDAKERRVCCSGKDAASCCSGKDDKSCARNDKTCRQLLRKQVRSRNGLLLRQGRQDHGTELLRGSQCEHDHSDHADSRKLTSRTKSKPGSSRAGAFFSGNALSVDFAVEGGELSSFRLVEFLLELVQQFIALAVVVQLVLQLLQRQRDDVIVMGSGEAWIGSSRPATPCASGSISCGRMRGVCGPSRYS